MRATSRAPASAWPALGGGASAAGRRNAAYAAALTARACAVGDAGDGVALNGGVNVLEAAAAALKPLPVPTAEAPVYLGVRPRGGGGGNAGPPAWGGLTNPLAALSPTAYAWPRGYPAAQGEAERGGAGAGVAELVRLAAATAAADGGGIRGDDVVVLQSALSGAADTGGGGGGGDASYRSKLPLVLLAPGAVAPYNALATLVRERGLWSLFLPPSAPAHAADVWRSYIAQAVFALCGLRVGFVLPWASRAAAPAPAAGDDDGGARTTQLLSALADWVAERGAACGGGGGGGAGCGAAALFEDAYVHLQARSVLLDSDVRAAQAWLLARLVAQGHICRGEGRGPGAAPR